MNFSDYKKSPNFIDVAIFPTEFVELIVLYFFSCSEFIVLSSGLQISMAISLSGTDFTFKRPYRLKPKSSSTK